MARHAEETKRVRGEHEQQMELTRTEHEAQVSELNNALDQVRERWRRNARCVRSE